jgi:predicted secreted Zn-dependent protease
MQLRYLHLFFLSFFLLYSSVSCAEISQYFDSDGNPLSSGSKGRPDSPAYEVKRYSIPDGIELLKDIRYEFYPVFGKTFSEIVRSAEENSPVDLKNKKRLPSRSDWTLGWSYKINYSEEVDEENSTVRVSVEIYDINITYDFTITLPTLIDDTALNPAEKNLWKNYYLRFVEYEHDHAKIIRDKDAQEELQKEFSSLNNAVFIFSTEIDIEKTAEKFIQKETEKIGRDWVKNLKKRSAEYDKATDYGFAFQKRDSFFSQKEK